MFARIHNSKHVTIDGRDCWVAALLTDDGKFEASLRNVSEHSTDKEAIRWAGRELRKRGERNVRIEIRSEQTGQWEPVRGT